MCTSEDIPVATNTLGMILCLLVLCFPSLVLCIVIDDIRFMFSIITPIDIYLIELSIYSLYVHCYSIDN